MPKEFKDPADLLTYLIFELKDKLDDKYPVVVEIAKRFRVISSGVHYIKKDKTKWEQISDLWESLKNSDMTKKEKYKRISSFTELSTSTIQRIVKDLDNPKIKRRISEKSLFEHYNED